MRNSLTHDHTIASNTVQTGISNLVIGNHNTNINMNRFYSRDMNSCNCRDKNKCVLGGKCMIKEVVYRCKIQHSDNRVDYYIGATGINLKKRISNHLSSSNSIVRSKATSLSNFIWGLKNKGVQYKIKWSIISRAHKYSIGKRHCGLCIEELYQILNSRLKLLNNRKESGLSCTHEHSKLFLYYK